jgi:serralysin
MRRPRPAPVLLSLLRAAVLSFAYMSGQAASAETKLHYAPNHNFSPAGDFLPAGAGFNLADVSKLREIRRLQPSDRALVWIGRCGGVDRDFLRIVRAYAGSRNLFGFFLMDDPDPRLLAAAKNPSHACSVGNLRAEADWIHDNVPGAKTIIVLMNMASALQPSFKGTYEPSNSHVDLFGLAAYPCRSDRSGCDYDIIDRYVAAAVDAGISHDRIVPIYQTFGGGGWATDTGGHYVMPTVQQAADILSRWHQLVPSPEMDMAYSWGTQNNDSALETAPDLQALFARYNRSGSVD